ncbi:hypothetical protein PT277_09630 [Acetobacteraceae bacterium ESL0709]|nr:hypothetical protein [Acetobacteraceae bacterium ESL0697]MDF7678941.1 hypothetical protein [Acetobacteraceae bacterium ESL0709]
MARVIILNCVSNMVASDGIKLLYQQAALLNEGGIEAKVFQPDGWPVWLDRGFSRSLMCQEIFVESDDVVVFPLTAFDKLRASLAAKWPCRKLFYCHDPYVMVMKGITASLLKEWGILKVLVPNKWCRDTLKSFMNLDNIDIIPPFVDIEDSPQILKEFFVAIHLEYKLDYMNSPFSFEKGIFFTKHPEFNRKLSWQNLCTKTEAERAAYVKKAALCLSFLRLETTGLRGLEAMAAGSLFFAPRGGGCADYARSQNGVWFSLEEMESLADMVFEALEGFENQSASYRMHLNEGFKTASLYTRQKAAHSIMNAYESLMKRG